VLAAGLIWVTVRQSVNGGEVSAPTGSSYVLSWGVPVVLSNAVPVGTGVVFDVSAVALRTDRAIELAWRASTGSSKNELTARCEGRFGLIIRNRRSSWRSTWPSASASTSPRPGSS
jgi:hypothetical protein